VPVTSSALLAPEPGSTSATMVAPEL
jgi:hypothetical protein